MASRPRSVRGSNRRSSTRTSGSGVPGPGPPVAPRPDAPRRPGRNPRVGSGSCSSRSPGGSPLYIDRGILRAAKPAAVEPGRASAYHPSVNRPVTRRRDIMRTFVYTDAKSNKFWHIELHGVSFTVTFGRVGTKGQTQTKDFPNAATAKKEHDK